VPSWERRTSVRHVFHVSIPPPCPLCSLCETFFFLSLCPLCSPGNAALQCGMSSTFSSFAVPSVRNLLFSFSVPSVPSVRNLLFSSSVPSVLSVRNPSFYLVNGLETMPLTVGVPSVFSVPSVPSVRNLLFSFSVPSVPSVRNLLFSSSVPSVLSVLSVRNLLFSFLRALCVLPAKPSLRLFSCPRKAKGIPN